MVNKLSATSKPPLSGAEEEKIVQRQYANLKQVLAHYLSAEDNQKMDQAFKLAWEAHKGTYRKSGESYIIHSLRTAHILAEEIGLDFTSVLCGILHDVVEDTSVSINKIKELFGPEVSRIVYGVTKIKKIFDRGESAQAENFRKLFLNLARDSRVIFVKLADRLDNMRTLRALPRRKQLKIAAETINIYVPLAHRLGSGQIKGELQDLYLKYIYPNVYDKIRAELRTTQKVRERQLDQFLEPIVAVLKKQNIKFKTKKRVKSVYAIWKKMDKKNVSLNEIYDLIAVRIIIDCPVAQSKALCWQVMGIVVSLYPPHVNRFKDWISKPKSNGYASLHATVMNTNGQWVEVQIRTEQMDEIASKGLAAHWKYKPANTIRLLDALMKDIRQVFREPKNSTIEAVEDIRIGLSEEEISVFTRKGKVMILPKGATVLDFAIEEKNIQGLQCSSALVNKRLVPLNYKLKNDDQVELIMSKLQKPDQDCLEFVVTPKARRIVKKVFKKAYETLQEKGKSMVEARLYELGSSVTKERVEFLKEFFDARTINSLYYKIGSGKIELKELATFTNFIQLNLNKVGIDSNIKKSGIMLKDEKKQNYKLAKCCDPIVGEEIFGVIGIGESIKVHRIDCLNALYILTHHADKVVKADWGQQERGTILNLMVTMLDQDDICKHIIDLLQDQCRIASVIFKKQQDRIEGELNIEVSHADQLSQIIHQLQQTEGVISAHRYAQH